jgi:hypothetical protein
MDHWFDQLARPHTRRTTLKAAALAGAALVVPIGRLPAASAAQTEACYKTCRDIAYSQWETDFDACRRQSHRGTANTYLAMLTGAGPGFLLGALNIGQTLSCGSSAELTWHRNNESCLQPQCGDSGKYPGGNAPGNNLCTRYGPGYVACGEECCDSSNAECCICRDRAVCCRLGNNCSCCGSSG